MTKLPKSIKPYKWRDIHDQLSDFEKGLEEKDYSFLYNNEEIISCLELVNQNCQTLETALLERCKRIIDLIEAKVKRVAYSRVIYKRLLEVTKKLAATLSHKNKKKNQFREEYADRVFGFYVQEQESRTRRNMPYLVSAKNSTEKIALSSVISTTEEFFTPEWSQIFERTEREIEQFLYKREPEHNTHIQRIMKKRAYNESFWKHGGMNLECLGCIPHFIENWNIFDINTNKTKLALVDSIMCLLIDSEKKYKIENDIKSEVSGFLNTTGGVVLFDCQRSYLNVIPRGQELVLSEVKEIRKELERIISEISPQPKIDENVFIQFVPIVKDPLDDFDLKTKTSRPSEQIPSQVVARIIVRPTRNNVEYRYPVRKGKQSLLDGSFQVDIEKYEKSFRYKSVLNHHDFILKVEVDENADDERPEYSSWVDELLDKPHTCFDHEKCISCTQAIYKRTKTKGDKLKQYKHQMMIPVQYFNIPEVRIKLGKYLGKFHLVPPFFHLKGLKGSNNTAILYHNIGVNWIFTIFRPDNLDFYIDRRHTKPTVITDYLKLCCRVNKQFPEEDRKRLEVHAREQFPQERISIRKQIHDDDNLDKQYYLKSVNWKGQVNKTCNLFAYLMLNQWHQDVQFCDPNGKGPSIPYALTIKYR